MEELKKVDPRRMTPNVVEDIIKTGTRKPGDSPGTWKYIREEGYVVINDKGDVFMFKKAALGISSLAITVFVGLGMATEASAGLAAPLSSLNVVQVESEQGRVETINPNSFSTTRNHGGKYVYIYTKEIGYGQNPFAKMNGSAVKSIGSTVIGGKPIVGWYYKCSLLLGISKEHLNTKKHLLTLHLIQCELQSISNKYRVKL
ncbi:hypothetical protein IIQ_05214 [Bacillus cereus VD118]|uniref:DUF4879 domain-containing protein n=1 Tax=Bacillus cereus VD118 TaxID=1053231 RepID=R8QC02_BACCE|nr:hypothetical protein IIQ_05214 [Bacillus cereus VD118]CAH2465981.1 hypothetical protein ACOSJ1_EBGNOMHC_05730 [Bacillus mycoides KBAB4]